MGEASPFPVLGWSRGGGSRLESRGSELYSCPSTHQRVALGKSLSLSQAFNKMGFGPYVPPGRGWQGQIMEGFGVSQRRAAQKGFERGG